MLLSLLIPDQNKSLVRQIKNFKNDDGAQDQILLVGGAANAIERLVGD